MVKATIDIEAELWKEFNRRVITIYGKLRGARNKALSQAIKDWLKSH